MSPEVVDSPWASGVTGDFVGVDTRPAHARDGSFGA